MRVILFQGKAPTPAAVAILQKPVSAVALPDHV